MNARNPDFRGTDEIVLPNNVRDLCGWTDEANPDERKALDTEKRLFTNYAEATPDRFTAQIARVPEGAILQKWNDFQLSKGRYPGSNDLSLLDEFVTGKPLIWLPQIIGSCVISNTFRPWVARLMWQVRLLGDLMEYIGRNEFTPANFAFYGPYQYGHARKLANMKGGDGLYAAPAAKSLMQGVLRCDEDRLTAILRSVNLSSDRDYPEPQGSDGARFYRKMGAWSHIDDLSRYAKYPLEECPEVRSADEAWDYLQAL